MRLLNAVVTRMLAAGLALSVWASAMLHVVKLRSTDDADPTSGVRRRERLRERL
jgi:hypothetical protein